MMEIKQIAVPARDLSLDEALGTGSGYLATFGNVDKQKDMIVKGAFAKCIAALEADRKRRGGRYLLPMLWQHRPEEPIGGIMAMHEDSHGLYIEFELDVTQELGRRAYAALKKSYIGGLSIGYRTIKDRMRSDGVRELLELQLIEGSAVTFPANDQAVVFSDSMKRDLSFEDEAGGLIAVMQDYIRRYQPASKAEDGQRSNNQMEKRTIYANRQYGLRQAARDLDLPERVVRKFFDEEANEGGLSRIGGGTWGMSGYELARKCNEHGYEVLGAWVSQGKSYDGVLLVTSQDNRARNAAFLQAIPEGDARDLRSDKEASELDYEQSKFRLPTEAKEVDAMQRRYASKDGSSVVQHSTGAPMLELHDPESFGV
jgi:HK97 family phage prohead protease